MKYEDSESIKADRVSTVVFNLHQIKRQSFFGHPADFIDFCYLPLSQLNVLNFEACG